MLHCRNRTHLSDRIFYQMQLLVEEYEAKVTISMQRDALKSAKGKGRESESGSLLHC
jgi:hypothetical protein